MSTPIPPHYQAFRIVFTILMLAALAAATWYVLLPPVLAKILIFLGVR